MATEDDRLDGLPRYVRINTLKITRGIAEKKLKETGHFLCPDPKHPANRAYFRDPWVPDVLVFKPKGHSDISRIPMIANGELVVQQLASCFPALALAAPPGAIAIDGCAAPGNKTSHLAALMQNRGRVFAFEINERRCNLLRDMMVTKGASIVVTKHASFLDASPSDPEYAGVTHVMLDPSCSSSGMSRNPETDPVRLRELADNQLELVLHAMKFPAVEVVCYSTCSIHEIENEEVVRAVLQQQTAFKLEEALPFWPRRGHTLSTSSEDGTARARASTADVADIARCVVRCSYPEDKTIGFFLARFVRKEPAESPALPISQDLADKLESLEKARAKRVKQVSKQEKRAQLQPRVGAEGAATTGTDADKAAGAKREIPSWRMERDARKKQKKKK